MVVAKLGWPQRTTMWSGLALLVGGALLLLVALRTGLAVTETFVVPIGGVATEALSVLLVAAGLVVLTVGAPGELGIVAESRIGKGCLGVAALLPALLFADRFLPPFPLGATPTAVLWSISAVPALAGAALVIASVIALRTAVLGGPARWALLALDVLGVLLGACSLLPVVELQLWLLSWPSELVRPVLLVVTGVLLLLHGRTEAVKHRAKQIDDAW